MGVGGSAAPPYFRSAASMIAHALAAHAAGVTVEQEGGRLRTPTAQRSIRKRPWEPIPSTQSRSTSTAFPRRSASRLRSASGAAP